MAERSRAVAELIAEADLRLLAGARAYARGVAYQAERRVRVLVAYGGTITARVQGTEEYVVTLWAEEGALGYECTCPVGEGGEFCKHCVAVALEYLERGAEARASADEERPQVTMDDVRDFLLRQEKESLVGLVLRQAMGDARLRRDLLLRTARERPEGIDRAQFRAVIDEAVDSGGHVDYRGLRSYVGGVQRVLSSLQELVTEEHAAEAIPLLEYALARVEAARSRVYDPEGDLGSVLEDLREMHHEACRLAPPDPEALAEDLFRRELECPWDTFVGAAGKYADVLGERGLARYRALAEAEWQQVDALGPGSERVGYSGRRQRLTDMMERYARADGDLEALLAIKARDLSHAYRFLELARTCQEAGRDDLALEWAERGLAAFPERTDSRLREFLAEQYHARGRHEEAMALIWAEFTDRPQLGLYRNLKQHADRVGQWPAWREQALAHVRKVIRDARATASPRALWYRPDASLLVEILLWEGDVEGAWQEAEAGGCRQDLRMRLAERREETHPEDSVPIYLAAADQAIARMNNEAYAEAVQLLEKANRAMARLGRGAEFAAQLQSLRTTHRRKRNFMKLLEGVEWRT